MRDKDRFRGEPTPTELAAIEAEWPLIAAELAVVDLDTALVLADDRRDLLAVRRLRRDRRRALAAVAEAARTVRVGGEAA